MENANYEFKFGGWTVYLLPCLLDNYIFVLHHEQIIKTIVVDPAESNVVRRFLQKKNFNLDEIWITHHHVDHIGGVVSLKDIYSCKVRGSVKIPGRIPEVDYSTESESHWSISEFEVSVLELPGHTHDHIAYWLKNEKYSLLFSGDVLFGLGCGRLFEGSYEQMFSSLKIIYSLPDNTQVFCTHEYTEQNLKFTQSLISIHDEAIDQRAQMVEGRRKADLPTVPLSLLEEKQTNLFLRVFTSINSVDSYNEFRRLRELRNNF